MSAPARASLLTAANQMDLSPAAVSLLAKSPEATGEAAVRALLQQMLAEDALGLALRLLPDAYAITWGCGCARKQAPQVEQDPAFRKVQAWIRDPSDANRDATAELLQKSAQDDVCGSLAAAVVFSAPQLGSGSDAVPVADESTALWMESALLLLAARDPDTYDTCMQEWGRQSADLLAKLRL